MKSYSETLAENELERLRQENVALREELQQSEDRFRNIPDEVWSKADLVEMIHKALDERDDANKQIAALRKLIHRMAKEMFEHGGSYVFGSLREYNEQMVRET